MPKKLMMNNSLKPQVDETIFAEYTFNNTIDSNCLPAISIVGGYEVVDAVDGNITRRILKNADKNKPTVINFNGKRALLTVDNLVAKPTTAQYMFRDCRTLIYANLSNLDTSNATSMFDMFSECHSLEQVNLSSFNASMVTNMVGMFFNCGKLKSLDLSSFNTSKVTNMQGMFQHCRNLVSLDLSSFNTSKVTNMFVMFQNCVNLTTLDLSSFDFSRVPNMTLMFYGCNSLTSEVLINNPNINAYSNMLTSVSIKPNSKFTVKYIDEATKIVAEKMVATKSPNSNVVLAESPTN